MAKHVSPSKIRYQERNPMISIRLTKPLRDLLDLARGEESYSKFIQISLKNKLDEFRGFVLNAAHNKGYTSARKKYEITYPCPGCGKPITMLPGEVDHEAVKKWLKEEGWGHGNCVR